MAKKWSKRSVTATLRDRDRRGLALHGVWRDDPNLFAAALRHFKNWSSSVVAAGFARRQPWDKVEIIPAIQAWYRNPTIAWDRSLASAARKHYGQWSEAVAAAGLHARRGRKWSRETIIKTIQDRYIRGERVDRLDYASRKLGSAARLHFGRWNDALRAAGLEHCIVKKRDRRSWSRQAIVEAIQAAANCGLCPKHIWRVDPGLYSAAKYTFGSWAAAARAAGYEPGRQTWSKQIVIEEIQRLAEAGRYLSASDPDLRNLLSAAERHCGSWMMALEAAGVRRRWSKEVVIEELRKRKADGVPLVCKHPTNSALCCAAAKFFGSWSAAKLAAGVAD